MPELLHHVIHGEPRDHALLLVHPLGADLRFWDECIAHWRHRVACIACDLRAAGASPRPQMPVTIAEHAQDLEALRQAIGVERVTPVGCAIGGMAAAAYAAAYPQRTATLILSNPALRTTPQARAMLGDRADLVRRFGMAALLPGAVDRPFLQQPRDSRYERYRERFSAQDPEAYALSCLAVLDADSSADLMAARCPVLVVAGGHDVLLPPEQAQAVHALLQRSEFVLFEDAAHFIPFQKPERFTALVVNFLDRNEIRWGASA